MSLATTQDRAVAADMQSAFFGRAGGVSPLSLHVPRSAIPQGVNTPRSPEGRLQIGPHSATNGGREETLAPSVLRLAGFMFSQRARAVLVQLPVAGAHLQ